MPLRTNKTFPGFNPCFHFFYFHFHFLVCHCHCSSVWNLNLLSKIHHRELRREMCTWMQIVVFRVIHPSLGRIRPLQSRSAGQSRVHKSSQVGVEGKYFQSSLQVENWIYLVNKHSQKFVRSSLVFTSSSGMFESAQKEVE